VGEDRETAAAPASTAQMAKVRMASFIFSNSLEKLSSPDCGQFGIKYRKIVAYKYSFFK
jgi:hypothetical protein